MKRAILRTLALALVLVFLVASLSLGQGTSSQPKKPAKPAASKQIAQKKAEPKKAAATTAKSKAAKPQPKQAANAKRAAEPAKVGKAAAKSAAKPKTAAKPASKPAAKPVAKAKPTANQGFNLVILHTNDTHGHIKPFPYEDQGIVGGCAKRLAFFNEKRKVKGINLLILDAGDAFQGTPLSGMFQGFVDVQMMNHLGYDAMALGNHEFDYGQSVLLQRIGQAKFPVLSANIIVDKTGRPFTDPFTIVERGGHKIAIVGLSTPDTPTTTHPRNVEGLTFLDPIEVAKVLVPTLLGKSDVVIALTHLGVDGDIKLANAVPGISVIVGGHSHTDLRVPMKVGDTLIVQDYQWGINVGMLKLSFSGDRQHGYKIKYFDEKIVPMDKSIQGDENLKKLIGQYDDQVKTKMEIVIGEAQNNLPNTNARSAESEIGNLVADVYRSYAKTDIAFTNGGGIRSSLRKGAITVGDVYTILPFDNFIETCTMTGVQLKKLLDESASQIGKGGFPCVSGVAYGIYDGKAYEVEVGGRPLDPASTYTVATNDFLVAGGDGYTAFSQASDVKTTGKIIRDVFMEYVKATKVVDAKLESRVYFLSEAPKEAQPAPAPEAAPAPAPEPAPAPAPPSAEPTPSPAPREEPTPPPAAPTSEQPKPETTPAPSAPGQAPNREPSVSPPTNPNQESNVPPKEAAAKVNLIGSATDTVENLKYDFSVEPVDAKGARAYDFVLRVTNSGTDNKVLSFPNGQKYDFRVLDGDKVVWNYDYNRFFTVDAENVTLKPGEFLEYKGKWIGKTNQRHAVDEKLYRFEAALDTSQPHTVFFQTVLKP
jgi:5'-nucleotidase